jgi:hypothetical protein
MYVTSWQEGILLHERMQSIMVPFPIVVIIGSELIV